MTLKGGRTHGNMRRNIDRKVDLQEGRYRQVKHNFRTKKLWGIPLYLLAITVAGMLVGAVLLGLIGGEQSSEITVTGLDALIEFDGDARLCT